MHKWLSTIPRERFHSLILEDLLQEPVRNSHDLMRFLDLKMDAAAYKSFENDTKGCDYKKRSIDYKHDPKLQMRNDTKDILQMFHQPFNTILAQLLSSPSISTAISNYW